MYINELTQEKGLQHNLGQLWEKRGKFHSLGWPVSCIIAKFHDP